MTHPATLLGSIALTLLGASCAATPIPSPPELPAGDLTAHTRTLGSDTVRRGTLEDLAFMVGRWRGEAFGGEAEETWNPIMGGQMLGTFRLVTDGKPVFSEHMLLTELDGGIVLRLKHFNPDLSGWEEKGEFVDFELLEVDGSVAWFDGLTIDGRGSQLLLYLAMETAGAPREELIRLRRDGES